MFCTRCGLQLRDHDRYCSQCGARTAVGRIETPPSCLLLDKYNKKIAGVCAGFARYCEVDVTLVRVLWLAIALTTGVGFLAYLAAWIIMPSDHGAEARVVMTPSAQAG
ncbi:Phage shock protein C, PspC [Candidatus Sulfopaludibacter sp. SbA4]|nr:Phage shock protein C, PspC [Candidatus Sulfopaludibacter sp. SbA4]